MKTLHFTTKQEGYGRQGLYFKFNDTEYYIRSVFPNIQEQFSDYELQEDCFFNSETETFTNESGKEVNPIDSWDDFLFSEFKSEIGEILFDELDHDDFEFDFENATYKEIAEWAINQ